MAYATRHHPNSLANLHAHPAPPAPRGHTRSLHHGGLAKVTIPGLDRARGEILDGLADGAPVKDPDGSLPAADLASVELAARALARVRSVDDWIAEHGPFDRD